MNRHSSWRALAVAGLSTSVFVASAAYAESSFDQEIEHMVRMLDLKAGAVVADIGAGAGEYAIGLSAIVGDEGTLHATEIEAEKRDAIRNAAKEAGASNIVVSEAQIEGTGLADASCDAVYLRDVYHHLTAPEAFAASLFATIRPGGRLMLVDFPPAFLLGFFPPEGLPENRGGHGIERALLIGELEAAGFVHIETVEKWPSSNFVTRTYGVAFDRP
jgi:SAM-dependent methyltransferase